MTPQARQVIHEVGARYGLAPELIVGRCRAHRLMRARVEIAKLLTFRGYSTTQIGAVLDRDHTTIVYYLGRGKKKPTPEKHGPITRRQAYERGWRPAPPTPPMPPSPPPVRRKFYLAPYAGADMDAYEWKARRA